jgi:rhodanese-related sulfurtransferase
MAARGMRPKVLVPNYKGIGNRDALDRKVPVNPKYQGVQTKLDTGARWRDDVTFNRPKRKNEFFGRVTADLLVQILDENEDEEENLYNLASGGVEGRQVVYDAAATGGAGGGTDELPYLLLDMRDQDAFEDFHIKSAAHFPATMLSRSTNCFTPAVLRYINHPSNIIVIYCDDEKHGIAAAANLAEKNVNNCYLLSGGIQNFATTYASYINGDVPDGFGMTAPSTGSRRTGTGMSQRTGTGMSQRTGTGASRASAAGGRHYGQEMPGGGPQSIGGGSRQPPGSAASNRSTASTIDAVRARNSHMR